MDADDLKRAIDAAVSTASALGLSVANATILQNSNKVALRLTPCDALARVSRAHEPHATFELGLAGALLNVDGPVVSPFAGIEPRSYASDRFDISFWTFHESLSKDLPAETYADALGRLHVSMRAVDAVAPHFMVRVDHAEQIVASRRRSTSLAEPDRELLTDTLRRLRRQIADSGGSEQLLHGEPHPGNVLNTSEGPLFIDLETRCVGPVEFDLAHAPSTVADRYPHLDERLLSDCRELVLAMVAAWRFDRSDQLPDGLALGHRLITQLRAGPPWAAIADGTPDSAHPAPIDGSA